MEAKFNVQAYSEVTNHDFMLKLVCFFILLYLASI